MFKAFVGRVKFLQFSEICRYVCRSQEVTQFYTCNGGKYVKSWHFKNKLFLLYKPFTYFPVIPELTLKLAKIRYLPFGIRRVSTFDTTPFKQSLWH